MGSFMISRIDRGRPISSNVLKEFGIERTAAPTQPRLAVDVHAQAADALQAEGEVELVLVASKRWRCCSLSSEKIRVCARL